MQNKISFQECMAREDTHLDDIIFKKMIVKWKELLP